MAHKTALQYSGKTVAVLPCGFSSIYPPQNKKLFDDILERGGLVVTEYDENVEANSYRFLERNRIVAGLGIALIVVEALERSGTSVTARFASSQGKMVFSLPGSLDNKCSVGTNNLIKNGANLFTEIADILRYYPNLESREIKYKETRNVKEEYQKIFDNIYSDTFLSLEEIMQKTGMPIREVITKLTLMEIEGLIEQKIGKGYRKKYE